MDYTILQPVITGVSQVTQQSSLAGPVATCEANQTGDYVVLQLSYMVEGAGAGAEYTYTSAHGIFNLVPPVQPIDHGAQKQIIWVPKIKILASLLLVVTVLLLVFVARVHLRREESCDVDFHQYHYDSSDGVDEHEEELDLMAYAAAPTQFLPAWVSPGKPRRSKRPSNNRAAGQYEQVDDASDGSGGGGSNFDTFPSVPVAHHEDGTSATSSPSTSGRFQAFRDSGRNLFFSFSLKNSGGRRKSEKKVTFPATEAVEMMPVNEDAAQQDTVAWGGDQDSTSSLSRAGSGESTSETPVVEAPGQLSKYLRDRLLQMEANGSRDEHGNTALHLAAAMGSIGMVGTLLASEEGFADSRHLNYQGRTPLHSAARGGHERVVAAILRHGLSRGGSVRVSMDSSGHSHPPSNRGRHVFNVNRRDRDGNSALHLAAARGHADVIRTMQRMADLEYTAQNDAGLTPVQQAAQNNHEEALMQILDGSPRQAFPQSAQAEGAQSLVTPLHIASACGHVHLVRSLLKWMRDNEDQAMSDDDGSALSGGSDVEDESPRLSGQQQQQEQQRSPRRRGLLREATVRSWKSMKGIVMKWKAPVKNILDIPDFYAQSSDFPGSNRSSPTGAEEQDGLLSDFASEVADGDMEVIPIEGGDETFSGHQLPEPSRSRSADDHQTGSSPDCSDGTGNGGGGCGRGDGTIAAQEPESATPLQEPDEPIKQNPESDGSDSGGAPAGASVPPKAAGAEGEGPDCFVTSELLANLHGSKAKGHISADRRKAGGKPLASSTASRGSVEAAAGKRKPLAGTQINTKAAAQISKKNAPQINKKAASRPRVGSSQGGNAELNPGAQQARVLRKPGDSAATAASSHQKAGQRNSRMATTQSPGGSGAAVSGGCVDDAAAGDTPVEQAWGEAASPGLKGAIGTASRAAAASSSSGTAGSSGSKRPGGLPANRKPQPRDLKTREAEAKGKDLRKAVRKPRVSLGPAGRAPGGATTSKPTTTAAAPAAPEGSCLVLGASDCPTDPEGTAAPLHDDAVVPLATQGASFSLPPEELE